MNSEHIKSKVLENRLFAVVGASIITLLYAYFPLIAIFIISYLAISIIYTSMTTYEIHSNNHIHCLEQIEEIKTNK